MEVTERILVKLAFFAALGDQAGARQYCGYMHRPGANLAALSEGLRHALPGESAEMVIGALPVLGESAFNPAPVKDEVANAWHCFVWKSAAPKVMWMVLSGRGDLVSYFRPFGATRKGDLLDAMRAKVRAEFYALVMEADGRGDNGPIAPSWIDRIRAAGGVGVAKSIVPSEALLILADDVVEFNQPTGGRPRVFVRLKEFDPRFNIYARPL